MYTVMMINLQDSQEMNSITPKMLDRRQSLFTSPSFKRKKKINRKKSCRPDMFSLSPVKFALDTYDDAVDIYSSNGPNIGDPTYTWGDPTEER